MGLEREGGDGGYGASLFMVVWGVLSALSALLCDWRGQVYFGYRSYGYTFVAK